MADNKGGWPLLGAVRSWRRLPVLRSLHAKLTAYAYDHPQEVRTVQRMDELYEVIYEGDLTVRDPSSPAAAQRALDECLRRVLENLELERDAIDPIVGAKTDPPFVDIVLLLSAPDRATAAKRGLDIITTALRSAGVLLEGGAPVVQPEGTEPMGPRPSLIELAARPLTAELVDA